MSVKVLFIGAHNDECEYDCGGTAKLLHDAGCEVRFLVVADLWHKDNITEDEKRENEAQSIRAAAILGAEKMTIGPHDAHLYKDGYEQVLKIESIILDYQPDIVFIHWPNDNHLEHRLVAKDSYQAVCIANVNGANIKEVYAFEAGQSQSQCMFEPDVLINVESVLPDIKESLMSFSQSTAHGDWLYDAMCNGALFRGMTSGLYKMMEAYKIIKFPNRNDDLLLKQLLNDYFRWYGNGMYPAYGKLYF